MSPLDFAALLPLLPEAVVGVVDHLEPITLGLSGAAVYAVTTSRGAYVLRVQARKPVDDDFPQQLMVLRRAAEAGVAPALVHVDEAAGAIVSVRVPGRPMAAVVGDPAEREAVLESVIDRLRTLHALDASGVADRDPVSYTRAAWHACKERPGFPTWAASLGPTLDAIAATLANDPRRVLGHNDVNPMNVLWDGARAWLVDWDVSGVGHPYYDLAVLAVFLRLDGDVALELVARHDRAPLDERSRVTFRSLRQLAGLQCGLTFLGLASDLMVRVAPTRADAPTLGDCYAAMRAGELDLQTSYGRASFGLAMLGHYAP